MLICTAILLLSEQEHTVIQTSSRTFVDIDFKNSSDDDQQYERFYESEQLSHNNTLYLVTTEMNTQHANEEMKIGEVLMDSDLNFRRILAKSRYNELNLNTLLKRKIAFALTKWTSPEYNKTRVEVPDVRFICRSARDSINDALLTLFTTVHNNVSRLSAFNNTITHWSAMQPALKPVLYVTPNVTDYQNNTFYLIERACTLNWDVAIAPNTNNESYPLIRSMFMASYQLFDSTWYGYSNGDILFDKSLLDTLQRLQEYSHTLGSKALIAGRRHDFKVWQTRSSVTYTLYE